VARPAPRKAGPAEDRPGSRDRQRDLDPSPGTGLVLEIEYHVTNHDPVPHMLRRQLRGISLVAFPSGPGSEKLYQDEHAIKQRRERAGLLHSVEPGETVHGV
jgi:hypothetical protein